MKKQWQIEKKGENTGTDSHYYLYIKVIANYKHNDIYGQYLYFDGNDYSIQGKEYGVDVLKMPDTLKEFKEIIMATTSIPKNDRVKYPVGTYVYVHGLENGYTVKSWQESADPLEETIYKLHGLQTLYVESRLSLKPMEVDTDSWDTPEDKKNDTLYLDISLIKSNSDPRISELREVFKTILSTELITNKLLEADSANNYQLLGDYTVPLGTKRYTHHQQNIFIDKILKQSESTSRGQEKVDISDWDDTPMPDVKAEPKTEYIDIEIKDEIKMMFPMPVLLEGPVGTGKSTILIELAEELGLKYYAAVLTDQTSKSEFTGYKNVMNGEMVRTEFREALEFGGLFVLEEINAATSNMPIIFNTIGNGYFVFADKMVNVHPDFRLCATMNTITNAKDFGGRRVLDKSVSNRFHKIMVMGNKLRFTGNTTEYMKAINKRLKKAGITEEVTSRDCQRFEHLVGKGMQIETAIKKTMIKELLVISAQDLTNIKKKGSAWEL